MVLDLDSHSAVYGRSAPETNRTGSIRPTSAPSAVIPPQMLGRSAPTELVLVLVYVTCMLQCSVLAYLVIVQMLMKT